MENDTKIQEQEEAQIPQEDVQTEDTTDSQDDVDWKERALKAEEAIKKAKFAQKTAPKAPLQANTDKDEDDIRGVVKELERAEMKRRFGYENNLSVEETDAIFKMKSNPTREDLDDPFIKGGLEAIRKSRRLAENTPSPSNNSSFMGKDFGKLSKEEKQQRYQEYMKKKFGN